MLKGCLMLFFLCTLSAFASGDFIPMTPIGDQCIPVSLEVDGDRDLTATVRQQLEDDIDFSGLLKVSDDGYAEAEVTVRRSSEGYALEAYVSSGGEQLLSRNYSGSSIYSLIHAFSDDLVYDLTGEEGVASTWVAYIIAESGSYSLAAKSLDPRDPRILMSDGEVITTPAWSPLGDGIAFTSYRSGNADLWLYDFGSSSASRILSLPGLNYSPAWSPDGSSMALTLSVDGNADIYLFKPELNETQRLTMRSSIETSPGFSPTGGQIVFTSDRIGYPQLYVMNSSGGTAIRMTNSHGYCDSPAWSPDGDRIAYTARVGGDFHIFVMDSDGSNIRQVTFDGTLNEDPVWGPTGRHIAFSSDMEGDRGIYMVELNGLTVRKLSGSDNSYCPTWSPLEFR